MSVSICPNCHTIFDSEDFWKDNGNCGSCYSKLIPISASNFVRVVPRNLERMFSAISAMAYEEMMAVHSTFSYKSMKDGTLSFGHILIELNKLAKWHPMGNENPWHEFPSTPEFIAFNTWVFNNNIDCHSMTNEEYFKFRCDRFWDYHKTQSNPFEGTLKVGSIITIETAGIYVLDRKDIDPSSGENALRSIELRVINTDGFHSEYGHGYWLESLYCFGFDAGEYFLQKNEDGRFLYLGKPVRVDCSEENHDEEEPVSGLVAEYSDM